jgi:hypothetical protein
MVDPPEEGEASPRPLLAPRSPEESAQIPIRGSGRVRQQRPCNCEVLFAGRAARDICSGNDGGLHRGTI